ncbi:FAD-dependent oxidoreductase [Streptomyces hyaluromycini]|uniref:FAD-dependent oxidoreductase n=1 Tax=Streptomyces hyaluromycini TaxID=1377993 RepID=UPI00123827C7|nr:FAD-binding protein [Streptomyces hyaluromycini]
MHVLVIGGGTGGMCLAHGLKKAGVSVAVYERYGSRSDGLYGYRVGIDPTGSRALHECLPPGLFTTFVDTCARDPRYFNVLTQSNRTTATIELPEAADAVHSERSVSRSTLRQVLFTGMDDVVHYGKEFTRYEQHPDGRVTAHFADGTTATGDVLVAADGTRSAVRRQYLPHAEIKDTGITAVATRACLTIPVCLATPCTHSRRTGRRPKYVQYEGLRPARREHAPDAARPPSGRRRELSDRP